MTRQKLNSFRSNQIEVSYLVLVSKSKEMCRKFPEIRSLSYFKRINGLEFWCLQIPLKLVTFWDEPKLAKSCPANFVPLKKFRVQNNEHVTPSVWPSLGNDFLRNCEGLKNSMKNVHSLHHPTFSVHNQAGTLYFEKRERRIGTVSLLKIERLFLWFTRVLHCKSRHIIISYHISCDVYNFARQLAIWTRPFRHFVKARGIVGTAGRTRRRRWVRTTTKASNEEGVGSEAPGKDEEWCRKINGSRKCPRRSTRILLVETYTMNKQYVLICFVHLFTVFASKMKY